VYLGLERIVIYDNYFIESIFYKVDQTFAITDNINLSDVDIDYVIWSTDKHQNS
jgi:hypothetical protein